MESKNHKNRKNEWTRERATEKTTTTTTEIDWFYTYNELEIYLHNSWGCEIIEIAYICLVLQHNTRQIHFRKAHTATPPLAGYKNKVRIVLNLCKIQYMMYCEQRSPWHSTCKCINSQLSTRNCLVSVFTAKHHQLTHV